MAFGGMTLAVARLGSALSRPGLWYRWLRKPKATPPPAAFGPIWAGLYAAMAVSAWRVWRAPDSSARSRALRLWGAQLGLNAAWSPAFFAAKRPRTALGIITALLPTLGRYVKYAREVDRLAGTLMVPYLAWTGFATYLNGAIVRKNAAERHS